MTWFRRGGGFLAGALLGLTAIGAVFLSSGSGRIAIGGPAVGDAAKGGARPLQKRLVDSKANSQAQSVAEAFSQRKNLERLSPLLKPKKFDAVGFKQNPKSYLDVVVPGRVFDVAQPTASVASIELQGDSFVEVVAGESVPLKVKVLPLAPVTYTSFDSGSFDNGLTSISVIADADGIATANFIATSDVSGECQLAIACPLTAGICDVTVRIDSQ